MNDAELDRLYALLPRVKRHRLHDRLIAPNSAFPFKEGPDGEPPGRGFAVQLGDYPAAVDPLSVILRNIAVNTQNNPNPNKRYSYEELRDPAGEILRDYLQEEGLLDEQPMDIGGRRRRKSRKHMTRRKRAATRRRRHGRSRRA